MQMRKQLIATLAAACLVTALVGVDYSEAKQTDPPGALTVLEFGSANTLFAADGPTGRIFAFDVKNIPNETTNLESRAYNFLDFGDRLAALLGTDPLSITYNDIAVHPVTKHAFVAVTVLRPDGSDAALVRATPNGTLNRIDVEQLSAQTTELETAAADDVTFWRDIPASSLTVTDLDFDEGVLYVSGLETGEFASALRMIPFPFDDSQSSSSVEIYHAAHNQNETRAPIRAMSLMEIDGKKAVVAAYTCTPLALIPVSDLEDGAHIVGKTIAELGYGNLPVEVLTFTAYNMQRQPEQFVLVINRDKDADLISYEDLVAASEADGISTPISALGVAKGVPTSQVPLAGVMDADDQDAQFILTLKRDIQTGGVGLVSFRKGSYFRLSDFVSEYNFPDFEYPEEQGPIRQFQNLLKVDEDYADQVVQ